MNGENSGEGLLHLAQQYESVIRREGNGEVG